MPTHRNPVVAIPLHRKLNWHDPSPLRPIDATHIK